MESIGSKSSSILDSIKTNNFAADIASATSLTPITSNESESFFSKIPWYFWLVVVLILAFLGFNLFLHFTKGSDDISNFFEPIVEKVSSFFGISAAKEEDQNENKNENEKVSTSVEVSQGQNIENTIPPQDSAQKTALYNALNKSFPEKKQNVSSVPKKSDSDSDYAADDSNSSIQQSKSANKAGWCYIGEDRGFRSCINVSENDTCMSGNIFPSKEICINPSLRA
jgi:hypothetical protein